MKRIERFRKFLDENRLLWLFIAVGTAVLNYFVFYWVAEILGSKNPGFIALMLISAVIVHEVFHFIAFKLNCIPAKMYFLIVAGGTSEFRNYKENFKNLAWERKSVIVLAGVFGNFLVIGVSYFLFQGNYIALNEFLAILNLNGVLILYNLIPLWPFDGGYFSSMLFDSITKKRNANYKFTLLGTFVGVSIVALEITNKLEIISFILIPLTLSIRAHLKTNFCLKPFDLHIWSRKHDSMEAEDFRAIPVVHQKWWAAFYLILILIGAVIVANTASWIFLVK